MSHVCPWVSPTFTLENTDIHEIQYEHNTRGDLTCIHFLFPNKNNISKMDV